MNLLFHLYLSGEDHDLLIGNFMGDFVKGPLRADYPAGVLRGLQLHRQIDSFAQRDASFQASRLLISPGFGLYRGVLVDMFYDHFLARNWCSWSDVPFIRYLAWSRRAIESRWELLPARLQDFVPLVFDQLLPSYGQIEGIDAALRRMARRLRRPNPLADGAGELIVNYAGLQAHFEQFIVKIADFAHEQIAKGGLT